MPVQEYCVSQQARVEHYKVKKMNFVDQLSILGKTK